MGALGVRLVPLALACAYVTSHWTSAAASSRFQKRAGDYHCGSELAALLTSICGDKGVYGKRSGNGLDSRSYQQQIWQRVSPYIAQQSYKDFDDIILPPLITLSPRWSRPSSWSGVDTAVGEDFDAPAGAAYYGDNSLVSMLPSSSSGRVKREGIANECCHRPCRLRHLLDYCAK